MGLFLAFSLHLLLIETFDLSLKTSFLYFSFLKSSSNSCKRSRSCKAKVSSSSISPVGSSVLVAVEESLCVDSLAIREALGVESLVIWETLGVESLVTGEALGVESLVIR